MKTFEKFLFFYSIIIISILFTVFGVISPKPINIISISLLLPLLVYFWIRLTSPKGSDPAVWSIRFFLSISVIAVIGVLAFIYKNKSFSEDVCPPVYTTDETPSNFPSPSPQETTMESKISPSPQIKEGESIADIIKDNDSTEKTSLWITGKDKEKDIDVYSENNLSSSKIKDLDPKLNYPYLEVKDGWYKVVIDTDTYGWVNSQEVYEI